MRVLASRGDDDARGQLQQWLDNDSGADEHYGGRRSADAGVVCANSDGRCGAHGNDEYVDRAAVGDGGYGGEGVESDDADRCSISDRDGQWDPVAERGESEHHDDDGERSADRVCEEFLWSDLVVGSGVHAAAGGIVELFGYGDGISGKSRGVQRDVWSRGECDVGGGSGGGEPVVGGWQPQSGEPGVDGGDGDGRDG